MSDCKKCREHMIEALYGELAPVDKDLYDRHLAACPECAAEHAALAETLRLMDKRERPDPGPEFWDGYWDRLSRRMLWEATEEGRGPSLAARIGRLFARLPRWSYQTAGAAALLLVGILIGSRLIGPSGTATTGAPATTAAVSAPVRPGPSSRPAILSSGPRSCSSGWSTSTRPSRTPTPSTWAGRKPSPASWPTKPRPSARGSTSPARRRLRELVTDLEVIMMQIANLEAGQDVDGVELIKQGVDRQGHLPQDRPRPHGPRRPPRPGGKGRGAGQEKPSLRR